MIQLDLNENLLMLEINETQEAIRRLRGSDLWQYYPAWTGSSAEAILLGDRLRSAWKISAGDGVQMLLCGGGDQALDLLFGISRNLGIGKLVFPTPAFSQYYVGAHKFGLATVELPLDEETFTQVSCEIPRVSDGILLITLPNNPTGTLLSFEEIDRLVAGVDPKLMLIDLAYGEFLGWDYLEKIQRRYPKALFLRTLSKAFGLAGLRIGCLTGRPESGIHCIAKKQIPFPMNALSMNAVGALNLEERCLKTIKERDLYQERTCVALKKYSGVARVVPSESNFNLVEFQSSEDRLAFIEKTHTRFRVRSSVPGLSDRYIRLTTGFLQAAVAVEGGIV